MKSAHKTAFDEIVQALQKAGIGILGNGNSTFTAYCANGDVVHLTLELA